MQQYGKRVKRAGGSDMAVGAGPEVVVVSLGGTVAMTTSEGSGARPTVDAAGLIAAVPQLKERARVRAEALGAVPSASLHLRHLLEVLRRLEVLCREGAAGVVVTTGTDTLEEVAYLFDLFWSRPEPLVVTGAMRTADALGSDGPANLLSAVTVAASPLARHHGCLAVMNDDVHRARAVRKAHTTRLDAFASAGAAPVGRIHEGHLRLGPPPPPRQILALPAEIPHVPKVGLLRLTLDQDVDLLRHAAQTHDGLVVEAFGAGHVPTWWVDELAQAARRIPVAITSRTGAGSLLRGSYAFPGSEKDLVGAGLLLIDDLDGVKARILLTAAIIASSDRKEIDRLMTVSETSPQQPPKGCGP